MSTLRPECSTGSTKPTLSRDGTLRRVYWAVKRRRGLIHGKLHDDGAHCAMGCFWEDNDSLAVPTKIIDEVAAVNDSVPPTAGRRERRAHMLRWLEHQLGIK